MADTRFPAERRLVFTTRASAGAARLQCSALVTIIAMCGNAVCAETLEEQVVRLCLAGKFAEAEPLAKKAVEESMRKHGVNHGRTAANLTNLAQVYADQGRYGDAEPVIRQAVTIYEKLRGPDDPLTGKSIDQLARVCDSLDKDEEAESLFKRAVAIFEKSLDSDDGYAGSSLSNLAHFYAAQGRHRDAETAYRRAIAIFEKAYGPRHPLTNAARKALSAMQAARDAKPSSQ